MRIGNSDSYWFPMPRNHVFDAEKGVIFVEAHGVFTDDEFRLGSDATLADPRFQRDLRTLVDFASVTEFRISAASLMAFVAKRAFSPTSRRAFVVGPGFGHIFVDFGKACGAKEQIQVFSSRGEAVAWLNEGVSAEMRIV